MKQYQESCGSESGAMRNGPRRGEVQYGYGGRDGYQGNGQYSSQDSLPDSPYSSQSLDSHASQGGPGLCFSYEVMSSTEYRWVDR